jgi:hypothetical protein
MDGAKSITANFFQPTLTVSNPTGYDNPVPAAGTYTKNYAASVTCSVTSPTDFGFTDTFESGPPLSGWTTGGDANWFVTALGEGFELGNINGWSTGGSANWAAATDDKHSGTYSAKSGNLTGGVGAYSDIYRTFTIPEGGATMTFWWRNASTTCKLIFYTVDEPFPGDWEVVNITGNTSWASYTYSLSAGTHTLKWQELAHASSPSGNGYIDDITFSTNSFAARSGAIGDNKSTYIERAFTVPEGGATLTFQWKVSSEGPPYTYGNIPYDFLEFYIDGELQSGRISGEVDWQQKSYSLAAGSRTLKWRYTKDPSVASGSDCGWIDNIAIDDNSPSYICTGYTGTGSCPTSGSGSSVTFTITQHSSITWYWKIMHRLTVSVYPEGSGTVGLSPTPFLGCYYDPGTVVTLTPSPAGSGYTFSYWSGDLTGTANPGTLTMDARKSVTANFSGSNKASDFAGLADGTTTITWSWTSSNTDWQSIAAGVLRTVYSTLAYPFPDSETCPRDGSRVLFGTIDVSGANTYTITYTKVSDTTWTCTADTNLAVLKDFYIDQTGVLKEAMSTGNGCQANSGSAVSPNDVWWEIQNSASASLATVWPNITSYQETGLSENTQYTRHVHAVNGAVHSVASNDASRYTLVHDATTSDFTVVAGTYTNIKLVGEGDVHRTGNVAKRYPIDIGYSVGPYPGYVVTYANFARCQMLLYGSNVLWEDYYGVYRPALDEIGQGGIPGKITRIRFQRAAGDDDIVNTVQMHIGTTTMNMLPITWTETTDHQLVYSGDLTIPNAAAGTWYEITLTSPFYYDGHSNLIISFRHQDGTAEDTYTTWLTSPASRYSENQGPKIGQSDLGGRCVAFCSDTQNPPTRPDEPDDWGFNGQGYTHFPNIKLGIEKGSATITVTNPPPNKYLGSTGVQIERAADSSFTNGLTVVQGYWPIYTGVVDVPAAAGLYYYRIRFCNGDGVANPLPSDGLSATVPEP